MQLKSDLTFPLHFDMMQRIQEEKSWEIAAVIAVSVPAVPGNWC